MFSLKNKKALIIGVANDQSIAYGCAKALKAQGADIAITYLNEKAERYVRPLAEEMGAQIITPLDVTDNDQLDVLIETISRDWGRLDILLHSIAFCPKDDLHGRVIDCSLEGFQMAMDISVHSFLRLIKAFEPIMPHGGTCMTVSYLGAERVVNHYNMMGPVKAALERAAQYVSVELGPKGISVHVLSPGPLPTRAASGIAHFDTLLEDTVKRTPTQKLATIEDVGAYAAFLASSEATNFTGQVHKIDGGFSITA